MQAPMSIYVRIILETLLQLFNNFQRHTQIDLRYRSDTNLNTKFHNQFNDNKFAYLRDFADWEDNAKLFMSGG